MGTVIAMTSREDKSKVVNSISPDVCGALDLNLHWNDSEQQRPDRGIRPLLLFQLLLNLVIIATLGIVGISMLCHL